MATCCFELGAGEAFVGHDGVAVKVDTFEHLGRDHAFSDIGRRELEGDGHPVRRAQQVEPKAPEVAAMTLAPAVAGVTGQLAASRRLARLSAGDRGAVEQSEVVAERRAADGQVGDDPGNRRSQRAQALVVAALLRQVGEQVPQPPMCERQKLAVVGDRQEHLRHGQGDELGVGDPRRTPRPVALGQEIVHAHIKCREQSVEVGEHETTSVVDVAIATPTFGALAMSPRGHPTPPEYGINHLVGLQGMLDSKRHQAAIR